MRPRKSGQRMRLGSQSLNASIEIVYVDFSYVEGKPSSKMCLSLLLGKMTAVEPTGSGKTTPL